MTFEEADDETKAAIAASAAEAMKLIGPRGGFRLLSFRYVNPQGLTVHVGTSIRAEAAALEAFFAQHGIGVKVEQLPAAKHRVPKRGA